VIASLLSSLRAGLRRAVSPDGLDDLQFIVGLVVVMAIDNLLSSFVAWPELWRALARVLGATEAEAADVTVSLDANVETALAIGLMLLLWLLGRRRALRIVSLVVLAVLTVSLGILLLVMVLTLFGRTAGTYLLLDGAILWVLIWLYFALWYWQLDGGGPSRSARSDRRRPEIAFPQYGEPSPGWQGWRPGPTDYLLLALTISLTFAPGDGSVILSRRMKWLLMAHMLTAAVALILLAGRALNIAG
jgi:hypothetical protein